jgi:hypothetical protein
MRLRRRAITRTLLFRLEVQLLPMCLGPVVQACGG